MISNRNTWEAKNMLDYYCQNMIITMYPGINEKELFKKFESTQRYNLRYINDFSGTMAQRSDVYVSNTADNEQLLKLLKLAHYEMVNNLYSNLRYDFGTGALELEVVESTSRSYLILFMLDKNNRLIGKVTTRSLKVVDKNIKE